MPHALILEFAGYGRDAYDAVNERLGIDPETGSGAWPPGLITHAAGASENGWAVVEVWESKEAQQRFMDERLGRALQEGGVTSPPSRVEWIELVSHNQVSPQAA